MKTTKRHTHFILLGGNTITRIAKDRGRKLAAFCFCFSFLQFLQLDAIFYKHLYKILKDQKCSIYC